MLFNSFAFILLFLPAVLLGCLFFKGNRLLAWLTCSSFFFYSFVGEKWFLIPMIVTTVIDYYVGKKLAKTKSNSGRVRLLLLSLFGNLGLLFYFKYSHLLFVTTGSLLALITGREVISPQAIQFLRIALPAGISFYTFQTLSYIIDVYREITPAETNFWQFSSFISFFPHLIAGPLTRHNQLIPQLENISNHGIKPRWKAGLLLFSIGLAKKVLIADRIASLSDPLIDHVASLSTATAWLALVAYALQLYFDFSGYSDMAIGLGRLFGIELPKNFNSPYRSKNPRDFWNTWHMTLGAWLRDYLFTPLSYVFVRRGWNLNLSLMLSLMITMFLGGLWHGANWTFAVFGLLHGGLLVIYHMTKGRWNALNPLLQTSFTFFLVTLTFVLFRSHDFHQSMVWYGRLFGSGGSGIGQLNGDDLQLGLRSAVGLGIVFGLPNASHFEGYETLPRYAYVALGLLTGVTFLFMNQSSRFLYFNF
jgi:alginate O-acetyltransferase complex protein AlgI